MPGNLASFDVSLLTIGCMTTLDDRATSVTERAPLSRLHARTAITLPFSSYSFKKKHQISLPYYHKTSILSTVSVYCIPCSIHLKIELSLPKYNYTVLLENFINSYGNPISSEYLQISLLPPSFISS